MMAARTSEGGIKNGPFPTRMFGFDAGVGERKRFLKNFSLVVSISPREEVRVPFSSSKAGSERLLTEILVAVLWTRSFPSFVHQTLASVAL